jgi:hypothetical protein
MTEQTPAVYESTRAFRGARFTNADLTGITIRDCDVSGLKIADCLAHGVYLSGQLERVVVNDVDVTDYVQAELDRRFPERATLRTLRTPDDYRTLWRTVEGLWSQTLERFAQLPQPARDERVDDEWSLVETLRHLVFATDAWVGSTLLDEQTPYHRLGLTHTFYPRDDALALGIDLDARPSFEEVLPIRAERLATVRRIVDDLTDVELARTSRRPPAPGYPDEERTVAHCLTVVMEEEIEHRRYMERDLAVLRARLDS